MVSILKKLRPVGVISVADDNGSSDYSVEYSFAEEYKGPPLSYSIPEVPALKFDQIPVAPIAPFSPNHSSVVPVIQPFRKRTYATTLKPSLPSSKLEVPDDDHKEEVGICGEIVPVPANLDTAESGSASATASSEIFSCREGDRGNDPVSPRHVKRPSAVTFRGPESNDMVDGDDHKEEMGFRGEIVPIPANSDTAGSGSTSASVSSEIFSCREGDRESDPVSPRHVRLPSAVTFLDPQSNDTVDGDDDDEFTDSEESGSGMCSPVSYARPPHAVRTGKKGTCYRCLKGNRFTEREVCIVCSAKYCRRCVLRAMGAMPQGRKCVTCIGHRIDESKRRSLGKFSRMLKHLLSDLEVKKIMHDEMFCEVNQIPAEHIHVNGEALDWDKLVLLLSCSNPPKGLKPGFYWYDKASGFWGKEGQRPCQFISPHLDVGGHLQRNASGGKTNITINGREITKEERLLLKIAGVQCEGVTDFWVSADGSYMEVGQRNVKGHIWDKFQAKVASAVLSLPVPSSSVAPSGEGEGEGVNRDSQDKHQQKMLYKFLLVGSFKSGTSTIFKQAKHLYNVPFSESERQNIKSVIQSNLFTYLGMLLEGCENFEEESLGKKRNRSHVDESTSSGEIVETTIYSIDTRLKAFSDWLIKYLVSGNLDTEAIDKYRSLVEELWSDAAIQATYNRRNELKLPRSATYFLDRAVEILKTDYEPSDMDIMYAEGITLCNSLTWMEFSFPVLNGEESLDTEFRHESSLRYQLIRVHPTSLGEKCKWLDMFEDTDVVLFSVALTDYDEYVVDNNGVATNKMLLAKQHFENISSHSVFKNKKFLLLLTKFDLLEEKIEEVPLTKCEWFSDFNPVISHNHNRASTSSNHTNSPSLAHRAFQYIAVKFKRLFHSVTERRLFVSMVTGLEPDTVDEALRYAREVMVWEKWDPSLKNEKSEITTTIDEASSS